MDAHAAVVEARVERVNATVADFEAEMADFFERLLAEEDPTRIATMAEAMPEPPDLAGVAASITAPATTQFDDPRLSAIAGAAEAVAEAEAEAVPEAEVVAEAEAMPEGEAAPEAAAEVVADPGFEPEPAVSADGGSPNGTDFAAAEAEAAAFTGDLDDDDGLAKLAAADRDQGAPAEAVQTEAAQAETVPAAPVNEGHVERRARVDPGRRARTRQRREHRHLQAQPRPRLRASRPSASRPVRTASSSSP